MAVSPTRMSSVPKGSGKPANMKSNLTTYLRIFQVLSLSSFLMSVLVYSSFRILRPRIVDIGPEEKLILFWTGWFDDPYWNISALAYSDVAKVPGCDHCLATINKAHVDRADMLVFHCREIDIIWPPRRTPNQIYAVECQESPVYTSDYEYLARFENRINMTVTYRRDSDVSEPYFGKFHKFKERPQWYVPKVPFSKKSRSVVWTVSNCGAASGRDAYVASLSEYIDVDIYGACGPYSCERMIQNECMHRFEDTYKFFLAFENSICYDYITEKAITALSWELIPVVMGGANYSLYLPKKSYINAADFESPKQLAEYLNRIANNEVLYNRYFAWKTQYRMVENRPYHIDLCEIMHNGTFHRDAETFSFMRWYNYPGVCTTLNI